MILIAYDGSEDALAAIEQAGALFPGEPATILTVWEPLIEVLTRTGGGFGMLSGAIDVDTIDAASERTAVETAGAGAERANLAGLRAQPRTRTRTTSVAAAILSEADDVDARAVIVGSRGLSGLKAMFLGSVSTTVLHQADRPVIVVTSAETAAARHRR